MVCDTVAFKGTRGVRNEPVMVVFVSKVKVTAFIRLLSHTWEDGELLMTRLMNIHIVKNVT